MEVELINIVSFGGGTNSAAMLVGLHQHGIPVDLILFADTGAEQPHTYCFIETMNEWLAAHNMPTIITVENELEHRLICRSVLQMYGHDVEQCFTQIRRATFCSPVAARAIVARFARCRVNTRKGNKRLLEDRVRPLPSYSNSLGNEMSRLVAGCHFSEAIIL